jgi:signal peptidase I
MKRTVTFVLVIGLAVSGMIVAQELNLKFSGSSGQPTIQNGEVLNYAQSSDFQRGHILVFNSDRTFNGQTIKYVKRLVGIPGDRIEMVKGRVFLNGKKLEEQYAVPYWIQKKNFDDCSYLANSDFWPFRKANEVNKLRPESPCDKPKTGYKTTPFVLKNDQYFVIGDNRSPGGSEDSRAFGPISRSAVIGVAVSVGDPIRKLEPPTEFYQFK